MPPFLTPEWIDALPGAVGAVSAPDAVVAVEVGSTKFAVVVRDGALVEATAGHRAEAECTFTATVKDAQSIMNGEVAPDTAFMQGRLKAAGAMDTVLALLKWSAGEDFASARARVQAVTD